MKTYIYTFICIFSSLWLVGCSDDDKGTGTPIITIAEHDIQLENVMFGDSLPFRMSVTDDDNIPLSTLKARLFFSNDMVSETVIRTKTPGAYEGKIYIPFLKDIPDGVATLKFVLQNVKLGVTEQAFDLPLKRPEYPYLTLVTKNKEYKMLPTGEVHTYAALADFPSKVSGYIRAPKASDMGNEIVFGWDDNQMKEGITTEIPFSNSSSGEYEISFNTLSYQASPFIIGYSINGTPFNRVDDSNYRVDINLSQNEEIIINGIDNFDSWWIDTDFFKSEGDKLNFKALSGSYRITANFDLEYLKVEVLNKGDYAKLEEDGSGAIWIIGENIGKPSLGNMVGWTPENALCMAPIAKDKYQVTFVAGKTIKSEAINFKFFYQKGWGKEFGSEVLTVDSDLVFIGTGSNGKDNGNLGLLDDAPLTVGATYQFTIDVSEGITKAVLSVKEITKK